MAEMEFYSPWTFLLLLILPLVIWYAVRGRGRAAVRFSSVGKVEGCAVSWRVRLRPLLVIARVVCVVLLIVAIARPRKGTVLSEKLTEAVAMEVVVDRSGSMQQPMNYFGEKMNRLEAAKRVFESFVKGDDDELEGRAGDLIGLITFARYADTKCPLVTGHDALIGFLRETDIVSIRNEDGTAIGDALALAAARLRKAEEELEQRKAKLSGGVLSGNDTKEDKLEIKSKVIILLTDGNNNAGDSDPLEAARLAKEWGIKVYTIGIGSTGYRQMGGFNIPVGSDLDERLLKAIADGTGGFYGRADDAGALKKIVEKIDSLEKSEVKAIEYVEYSEKFRWWAAGALAVLLFEIFGNCTVFRKIP